MRIPRRVKKKKLLGRRGLGPERPPTKDFSDEWKHLTKQGQTITRGRTGHRIEKVTRAEKTF